MRASAVVLAVGALALTPLAAQAQTRMPSQPNPVNAAADLNAAVVPPQPGSPEDTPANLRDHEERTEEAFDPNNPTNTATYRTSGTGCEPGNGALLSCGTNRQVANQPTSTTSTVRDQTPDADLMGRPR